MLASPYLNTLPATAEALARSPADLTVVVASDASHGFAGASGLAAYLPAGYALLRAQLQSHLLQLRGRQRGSTGPEQQQATSMDSGTGDGRRRPLGAGGPPTEFRLHRRLALTPTGVVTPDPEKWLVAAFH